MGEKKSSNKWSECVIGDLEREKKGVGAFRKQQQKQLKYWFKFFQVNEKNQSTQNQEAQ